MSTSSYLVAWIWYLAAVVGLSFAWWRLTRGLPSMVRDLVRALPAAWALTPWTVAAGRDVLAPAWLVALFEGFLREEGSLWRAGQGLLLGTVTALLVVLVSRTLRRRGRGVAEGTARDE